ncbi:unnamed protein product [Paramecium sonneborni]|uniref:Uncharacterized protein n=1 Tax=Paramecium sonneborni TaxID=65129 RepID=A0A8S1RPH3_9CILI|nr:unnamed protein product [Paramecium sonneborni]
MVQQVFSTSELIYQFYASVNGLEGWKSSTASIFNSYDVNLYGGKSPDISRIFLDLNAHYQIKIQMEFSRYLKGKQKKVVDSFFWTDTKDDTCKDTHQPYQLFFFTRIRSRNFTIYNFINQRKFVFQNLQNNIIYFSSFKYTINIRLTILTEEERVLMIIKPKLLIRREFSASQIYEQMSQQVQSGELAKEISLRTVDHNLAVVSRTGQKMEQPIKCRLIQQISISNDVSYSINDSRMVAMKVGILMRLNEIIKNEQSQSALLNFKNSLQKANKIVKNKYITIDLANEIKNMKGIFMHINCCLFPFSLYRALNSLVHLKPFKKSLSQHLTQLYEIKKKNSICYVIQIRFLNGFDLFGSEKQGLSIKQIIFSTFQHYYKWTE